MRPNVLLMLLLVVPAPFAWAAGVKAGDQRTTFTSSFDGSKQPYRLFIPRCALETTAPLPFVVVLHGWGANENSWFDFTPVRRVAEQTGTVVASPLARGNWWYRGPAEADVLDMIRDVQHILPVDENRIHLMGHSMGGWGAWFVALRHPELFASICPMSGFYPGELLPGARNLSPLIVHDQDDPIVPVANSRRSVRELASLGISFQYREETGFGHSSKLIGANLPRAFEWFAQHPKKPSPAHISFASRSSNAATCAWITILERSSATRYATVDVQVNTTENLVITTRDVPSFAIHLNDLPTTLSHPLAATVDAQPPIVVKADRGWLIFKRGRSARWAMSLSNIAPTPPVEKPIIGAYVSSLQSAAGQPDRLAQIVAGALMRRTCAKACVLDPEKLHIPAQTTVTRETILDLSAYPDERLAVFTTSRSSLARAHEAISARPISTYPANAADKTGRVTVVMPAVIAAQFTDFRESRDIHPSPIGEVLLEECGQIKSLRAARQ